MKNEVIQKDFDMPQLRQMVLDNTERINKNELIISQMRKENLEQSRKAVERDEMLENSRREHDRWSQRMRETLDEIAQIARRSQIEREKRDCEWEKRMREQEARSAEGDRKMREQFKENDRWMKEQFAENDRKMRERMEESDRKMRKQFEETEKQLKDTSLEVKRLSRQLSGTTGHIVEGLVSSSTKKIFQKAGLDLHNSGKNLKRSLPAEHIAMEVDVLLSSAEMAVPIEVKANCTKDDIYRFLHQMRHFRRLFPEYDGKEVFAAIAAINYEKGVAELAHKEKLLVIRVNSDDIFSIDPFKREDLLNF
ncbi:MAG: hypothetical protein K5901_08415 [Bacteroidales bacterium]|nr:hypothetical protein [Bacteroidales bacterium]